MYCQKQYIEGLDNDARLSKRIFENSGIVGRAVLVWEFDDGKYIYGACNFKKDAGAENDFKFCELKSTMLTRNFRIFVKEFKVREFVFIQETLMRDFEERRSQLDLVVQLKMASADESNQIAGPVLSGAVSG